MTDELSDAEIYARDEADEVESLFGFKSEKDASDDGSDIEDRRSEYLDAALAVRYVADSDGEKLGFHLLVAFGGPNVWVDTDLQEVRAYWGFKMARHDITDIACKRINERMAQRYD